MQCKRLSWGRHYKIYFNTIAGAWIVAGKNLWFYLCTSYCFLFCCSVLTSIAPVSFLNIWIYRSGYDANLAIFYCLLRLFEALLKKLAGKFWSLVGEDSGRCGLSAGVTMHQLHLIIHGDFATFNHKTVKCAQLATRRSPQSRFPNGNIPTWRLKKEASTKSELLTLSLLLRLWTSGCQDRAVHIGKLLGHIGMEELIEFLESWIVLSLVLPHIRWL